MLRASVQQLVNSVDHFLRQDFDYTRYLNCTEEEAITLIAPEWAKVEFAAADALGDAIDPAERTFIARIQTTVTNASDADQLVQAQEKLQALWPDAKAAFLVAASPSQPAASSPNSCESDVGGFSVQDAGDYWKIRFDANEKLIKKKGNKGFELIVELLRKPYEKKELEKRERVQTTQEIADRVALAAYEKRYRELNAEIEEYDSEVADAKAADNEPPDPSKANKARLEMMQLADAVKHSKGFNGRLRDLQPQSGANKDFDANRKAIERSIENIRKNVCQDFAKYLENTIQFQKPAIVFVPAYDPVRPQVSWKF